VPEAAVASLAAVRAFVGDDVLVDPESMPDAWSVSEYKDAWLARPKQGAMGGFFFLVRGAKVQPFQLAEMSLEDANEQLLSGAGG
jgi:hypothetical protein